MMPSRTSSGCPVTTNARAAGLEAGLDRVDHARHDPGGDERVERGGEAEEEGGQEQDHGIHQQQRGRHADARKCSSSLAGISVPPPVAPARKIERHAEAVEQAAVGRVEQRLALDDGQVGPQQVDQQGRQDDGEDRLRPELQAQIAHADQEERQVERDQGDADRPAPQAVGELGERGEAAGDDVVRVEEDVDRQRHEDAAGEDEGQVEEDAAGNRPRRWESG